MPAPRPRLPAPPAALLALAVSAWAASAALAATGGPDAYGYTWRDSAEPGVVFAWEDISATGADLAVDGDDYNLGFQALSFPVRYYGVDYTTLAICSNGWVSFVDATSVSATNTVLPNTGGPSGTVALLWDDLRVTAGTSHVWFEDFGDRVVVTYEDVHRLGEPAGRKTFQLVAHADGRLVVQYLSILGRTDSCTLGIENPGEDDGLTVHHNTASLPTSSYRVEFTPPTPVPNDLDCGSVVTVACPSTTAGDLASGSANQDTYRCDAVPTSGMTGREQIYRIDIAATTDLRIELDATSGNPTAFLLAACDANACLEPPATSFLVEDIAPGSYYVVVDAPAGDEGAYTLTTECVDLGPSFPFCDDESLFESEPWQPNGSWLVFGWLYHPSDTHNFALRVNGTTTYAHDGGGCSSFTTTEAASVQPSGPGLVTWTFPEGRIDAVMSETEAGGCCGLLVEVTVTNTTSSPHSYEYRAYHDTAFGIGNGTCTTGVVDGGTIEVAGTRYDDEQDLLALGADTCAGQVKMYSAEDPVNVRSSYQVLGPTAPEIMEFIQWNEGGNPCTQWSGFVSGEVIGECFDDNSLLLVWRFPPGSGTLAPGASAVIRYRIGWECEWPCCEAPVLAAGSATDADPCHEGGVRLAWDAAAFPPPGNGVYHVYRSTVSFADALLSPRVSPAGGLTVPSFDDSSTVAGTTYYYVVQAESVDFPDCGDGPLVDGSTDTLDLGPVTDQVLVVDAGQPKTGCVGAPIALSDAAAGSADAVSWSDGGAGGTFTPSATVLRPSYQNASAGTYTLTLTGTITSAGCSVADTVAVTVQPIPVASFTPPSACEDQVTCFTNTSPGPASWLWDFGTGDGASSTEEQPCFVYSTPGTYTVTLRVTNDCGTDLVAHQVVVAPKPAARFSWSTTGGRTCVGQGIDFTDLSTNAPTTWTWDFGDGTTSILQNPSHVYLTDGIKLVSLVACNACGCSPPHHEAVEIAASCNTNCEANSNQVECGSGPGSQVGDTCTDHDNFNTTSYPCAPGIAYTGENKIYDLNFLAGSNFIVTVVETEPEPNGYDLDVMISLRCNPPDCGAWGDESVEYDDRTPANDDFWVIVDGRDGTCGPYRLEVQCLPPASTGQCRPPAFSGVLDARDLSPCDISGVLVEWASVVDWGADPSGAPCAEGTFEIWRAPASDPTRERRVGTATTTATSFVDVNAVPGVDYVYRVNAVNSCCGEPAITTATATASDGFIEEIQLDAGPSRRLTCDNPAAPLLASVSGGSGDGFDFAWTPPSGLSNAAILNPTASAGGTYTLTATDRATGCAATDSVVVVAATTSPTVGAGPDQEITCSVRTVMLAGSATGGDGSLGYSYSWTPAGPLSNPSIARPTTGAPGLYRLDVEDLATGCTGSDEVLVVRNDSPPLATAGPDVVLDCTDPVATLSGGAFGGDGRAGYSFSWNPRAGLDDPSSPRPVVSAAGTYTLTVVDLHTGCTDTDSVVVTTSADPPIADAGAGVTLTCAAPRAILAGSASGGDGSAGYAYAWRPPEAVESPNAATTGTRVPGTYTLTVIDLATGCTDTDTVTVARDPAVPLASAGPDGAITCTQLSAPLAGSASGGDGSAGYSFRWEPAAQVADPDSAVTTATDADVYTLTVTDLATGCTGTDVVVIADLRTLPTASAGQDAAITCAQATAPLAGAASGGDGTAGYLFRWEPAADVGDPDAAATTALAPGTFTLTVTDVATGCTAQDTVTIADDRVPPTADAGADVALTCLSPTATLAGAASGGNGSAGYAFAWEPAADVTDPAAATTTTSVPGTYTLTVTDLANDCVDADVVVVTSVGTTPPEEPSALDLRPAAAPLRVTWQDALRTQLHVAWEDVAAFAYHLHAGDLDALRTAGYTHGMLSCVLAAPSADVPPPSGDVYLIAVSVDCLGNESSYGRSSLGVERPDAAAASGRPCP